MNTVSPSDIIIRDVSDADMPAIHEIYAHQVLHGVSSWEEEPPSLEEIILRRDNVIQGGYPYRVAVMDGVVVGYSYASAYRPRPGYRHTVENSIYIAESAQRLGLGKRLLEDLISICTDLNFRQMIAVVGDSENVMSIDFHTKMGFRRIGTIDSIGYKFGRWLDSVILQLNLGDGDTTPPVR